MVEEVKSKDMRYFVSYGPDDKRDRWGHTIEAAPIYNEYTDSYVEAENIAIRISKEHKKWDVHIYDTLGPIEDEEYPLDRLWCISSYKGGRKIFQNDNYHNDLLFPDQSEWDEFK